MAAAVQQPLIDLLRPVLSDERVGTYLKAAGHDPHRALALYLWNAKVGEAFHILIQAVEVGLRNRIAAAFRAVYGPDWWLDPKFRAACGGDRIRDLDLVVDRITKKGRAVTTCEVVAGLSLGFWVALLQARYNPGVWSSQLRATFLALPAGVGRGDLAKAAGRVAFLRNRIDHHEPIIRMDLSKEFSEMMILLGWICPIKQAWVRPHCRVPDLLRQKP